MTKPHPFAKHLPPHWKVWLKNGLTAYDFPPKGVEIEFADGSFIKFKHAFFVVDKSRKEVVVFTEHNGYHLFHLTEDDEYRGNKKPYNQKPLYPFIFVFNETAAGVRQLGKDAEVRYEVGPSVDGLPDFKKGIYVHADDLKKFKEYLLSTGQLAEAESCQEAIFHRKD